LDESDLGLVPLTRSCEYGTALRITLKARNFVNRRTTISLSEKILLLELSYALVMSAASTSRSYTDVERNFFFVCVPTERSDQVGGTFALHLGDSRFKPWPGDRPP
jgi:hypothetical protein